ncbi:MAG: HNH endonuclease [Nitrospira sp.]|nr:HNH endonuclease [Nitrospira sp.]
MVGLEGVNEMSGVPGQGMIPLSKRFWERVNKNDACWIWEGSVDKNGYGQIWINSKKRNDRAHRVSFELNIGVIPDGMFVLHKCDNPPCVNPDHLFLGTVQDNVDDMIGKHRQRYRGGITKLTSNQVLMARKLSGHISHRSISRMFGVSHDTIDRIVRGSGWRVLSSQT